MKKACDSLRTRNSVILAELSIIVNRNMIADVFDIYIGDNGWLANDQQWAKQPKLFAYSLAIEW